MQNLSERVNKLGSNDLVWKPLYPNNMPTNGLDGYYCLILHTDKDGIVSGRKYTIVFQHKEVEDGTGFINREEIDRYVLFEKSYYDIKGPLEHPAPSDDFNWSGDATLNSSELSDYGHFVYAYETLDIAIKRALVQYKAIFGYVLSFLTDK